MQTLTNAWQISKQCWKGCGFVHFFFRFPFRQLGSDAGYYRQRSNGWKTNAARKKKPHLSTKVYSMVEQSDYNLVEFVIVGTFVGLPFK